MSDDDRSSDPLEQLVELLIYAPVGLLYEYEEVLPKLVRRGKSQVALARFFGQAAMRKGSASAEGALGDVVSGGVQLLARAITELGSAIGLAPEQRGTPDRPAAAAEPAADTEPEAAPGAPPEAPPGPGLDLADEVATAGDPPDDGSLPIAGYDQLPARVIISLLEDLSPTQRAQVRRHEEGNRARKTVLAKLDRLDLG